MRRPGQEGRRVPGRSRSVGTLPSQTTQAGSRPERVTSLLASAHQHHTTGRHDDAEHIYRRVLELDAEQPDALHLLGVLALQRGQAERALPLIEQALARRPAEPSFHLNYGNVLFALGRHQEAVASYRRAAALAPADPEPHNNLGYALIQTGQPEAGIAALRQAIQLHPGHVAAHAVLADVLREIGRHGEAAPVYGRLVELGYGNEAAYDLQAQELVADGRPMEAYRVLVAGLERYPRNRRLILTLLNLFQRASTVPDEPVVRDALLAAATDDSIDALLLSIPVTQLVVSDPGFQRLLAAVRSGGDPLRARIPLPATLVDDPLVLAVLPRTILISQDVERVLTALRRAVLVQACPRAGTVGALKGRRPGAIGDVRVRLDTPPLPRPFLCALARAAFLAEYAWLPEPDEIASIRTLRATVGAALARPDVDPAGLEDLLILTALYGSLGTLPGAERLAAVPATRWSAPFAPLVQEQVVERLEEAAIAATLPTLTPIASGVSEAVRSLYEENPYPRWRAARFTAEEPLTALFRRLCPGEEPLAWPSPLPVLIAGAGSGRHPANVALRMPEADILAVDLSRASLAYGARMARRLGIQNVRFAQADILALDVLDQRFALVECSGVLHHLQEPLAGWRVLLGLLRPDGLMNVGLYSERARASVVAARELIARTQVPPTPEGIQLARRLLLSLPPQHPAAGHDHHGDFYSVSGFRDLVMHVQEHRFTIPRLAEALDELNLQFLGFNNLERPVLAQFRARFPEPGAERSLACWDQFEAEQPDTFVTMYQFWCRPRR